jgi:hypothetical protein
VRFIKMLGLAGAVALIAMAFAGAGTASADSACLVDVGANGACPAGSIWQGPVIGLSKLVVFKIEKTETKCKSGFLADYLGNEGAHVGVTYLILGLGFKECTGDCEKATAEALPYVFLVSALQNQVLLIQDGIFPPAVLLENCMVLGVPMDCLYQGPEVTPFPLVLEKNQKGEPLASALDLSLPLTWAGDDLFCPQTATWNANYLIYEDNSETGEDAELFFASLP